MTSTVVTERQGPSLLRLAAWALGGVAAASAAAAPLAGVTGWLAAAPFVLAPLAVAVAAEAARSAARPGARATWRLVAVACVCGALGEALSASGAPASLPSLPLVLAILFHVCIAEGAILALRPARDPRLAIEIALDGVLVLLAAAILVVRLQLDLALAQGWLSVVEAAQLLIQQIAVVGSLLFCALLVLWRDGEIGGLSIDLLLVAALLFSFGDALGGVAPELRISRGSWFFDAARLLAWAVLAAAAAAAWYRPGPTIATSRRSAVARAMRLMVIPAAVLFLAAWSLSRPGEAPPSALSRAALGALGLVLAVRVGAGIYAVEREARERQAAETLATRARIRAITAQMNPHFLFNALHSLAALLRRDARAAEGVLERLGALLRYGLDRGDAPLPFADEWEFTRSYVQLEEVRLGSRLSFEACIPQEAADCLVPPFILQPLVENAIRHSIDASPGGGRVAVTAALRADGSLGIEVYDSGPGADEQALWQGNGVGLRGVRAQLAAHFGDQARMEAERPPNGGFVVRLVLPRMDD